MGLTGRKITPLLLSVLLISVSAFFGCRFEKAGGETEDIHIGYMICNSLAETKERFDPLCAYLSDVMGMRVVPHYINTFEFEKEIEKGYLQVAHTNSLLYVIFHENRQWTVLAGEKEGSRGAYTSGVIFVKGDSPIESIDDLKGKKMIFGPEMAPMGFLSQYYLLLERGFDPEIDLGYYAFPKGSFSHEKVVYSVLYGGYDAGSVPLLDLENMEEEGKITAGDYRILAEGENVPYCTFSTAPDLPAETRAALLEALLGLSKDTTARVGGEVLNVLGRAGVDGFERIDDSAYEPIRRMARRVKMPPYQEY